MKLVFVHGSGACGDVWMLQKQHFTDADNPDLPGHPRGEICTSVEDYTDWLHGYFQEKEYTDVVLAGHSLGGGIALMHALKYPKDLKGIILLGSGARLRVLPLILELVGAKLDDTQGWLKELIEPLHVTVDEKIRQALMPRLLEVGPAAQLNDFRCCDKFDVMDRVGQIKLPALCIVGDQDNMTPPKYSQYLAGKMPDCRMSIIEGGTHLAFLEKPAEVNRAIESFIKQIAT
ncbi:MAG: alpha/beta hydrolase [Dehalococcoidia bacterium]|nr:alpha/beta hydrolase [Dehalococcoidia bacterium]